MRLPARRLLAMLALAAGLGCISAGRPAQSSRETPPGEPPSGPPGDWSLVPEDLGTQSLFRVQYQGPDGDGGLRLVLRLATADRFQLNAADTLGRAVWSVDVGPVESVLVSHREEAFCVTPGEVRLPETALGPLPLRSLPRVLLGRLPVPPSAAADPFADRGFVDAAGRRWTARAGDDPPAAWTLYDPEGPLLWWTRQSKGGILSHRDGVQFRWRRVVAEPLSGALAALPPPAGYERRSCDDPGP